MYYQKQSSGGNSQFSSQPLHNKYNYLQELTFGRRPPPSQPPQTPTTTSMSESQFQHLTEESPVEILKKHLHQKSCEIAQLKIQLTAKNQTIYQNNQFKAFYQESLKQKQQQLKQLTIKTFKLSQKLIQQQQDLQMQKQDSEHTDKKYQELLESQLEQKQSLLIVIEQLSSELKLQQQANSEVKGELQKAQGEKEALERMLNEERQEVKNESEIVRKRLEEERKHNQNQNHQIRMLKQTHCQQIKALQQTLNKQMQSQKQSLTKQMQECRDKIAQLKIQLNTANKNSTHHLELYLSTLKQLEDQKLISNSIEQKEAIIEEQTQKMARVMAASTESQRQNQQLKALLFEKESELIAIHLLAKELQAQVASPKIDSQKPTQQKDSKSTEETQIKREEAQSKREETQSKRIRKLEHQIKEFEEIIQTVISEKETYHQQNTQLRAELRNSQNTIKTLQSQLDQYVQSSNSKDNNASKQQEHASLSSDKSNNERMTHLQEQNKQLIQMIEQACQQTNKKNHQLQSQGQKQQAEKESLSQQIQRLTLQLQSLQQTHHSLKDQFKQHQQSMNEFLTELDSPSIDQVFDSLQVICAELHQTVWVSDSSEQDKQDIELKHKMDIFKQVEAILFPAAESKNKIPQHKMGYKQDRYFNPMAPQMHPSFHQQQSPQMYPSLQSQQYLPRRSQSFSSSMNQNSNPHINGQNVWPHNKPQTGRMKKCSMKNKFGKAIIDQFNPFK